MPVVTQQELIDAATDVGDLETIVNGSVGDSPVTTRLGGSVKTIAKILQDAEQSVEGNAIQFQFDGASTSMAEPTTGFFRLNHGTIASATAIAVTAESSITGNPDLSDFLTTWDDSGSTIKGQLLLRKFGEPQTFAIFNITAVTDNTGWLQLTIAYVTGNGSFVTNDIIGFQFTRTGDTGDGSVKVSSDDTTPSDLETKLLIGTGLSFTTQNPGGNETRTLDLDTSVNIIGSVGGGTQDIDLDSGRAVSATIDTSTTTFTFSNPRATGNEDIFTLRLTNGGSQTVNWPASVEWVGGVAPTLTTSGVDELVFKTIDGGTTWVGSALLDVQ